MTQLKVIRLRPESAFRTDLRSDTLWGLICWGIRAVYGNERLEAFLNAYQQGGQPPLLLSSAFPYVKDESNGAHFEYFLPKPLFLPQAEGMRKGGSIEERKAEATGRKKLKKLKWLPKPYFEKLLAADDKRRALQAIVEELEQAKEPLSVRILSEERVHIGVNRLTGGTKIKSGAGLVFHAEEKQVIAEKRRKGKVLPLEAGLYFLYSAADPATEQMMLGALRFMAHIGLGGNRSIGKGKFTVEAPEAFKLQPPAQANAQVTLSLCHPTEEEVKQMQAHPALTAYELETRQGETGFLYNATKVGVPCLREGSVLPVKPDGACYGTLTKVRPLPKSKVSLTIPHDLFHYGFALTIPAYYS
ncbi:type III-A CRISPR-associated RAMP protein Csm4 [Thermonema rossianum]|uniref:type III-A CRISPR-associated RAMP protein Csm4 n=1 Tax=Thermonema rossianum TaxID=55505 RepID=UPI0005700F82|nr:type III-A CRISPR-associated RAMP protein Csm4 [Thermonema rossianum]